MSCLDVSAAPMEHCACSAFNVADSLGKIFDNNGLPAYLDRHRGVNGVPLWRIVHSIAKAFAQHVCGSQSKQPSNNRTVGAPTNLAGLPRLRWPGARCRWLRVTNDAFRGVEAAVTATPSDVVAGCLTRSCGDSRELHDSCSVVSRSFFAFVPKGRCR